MPGLVVQRVCGGLVQIEHQGDTPGLAAPPFATQQAQPGPGAAGGQRAGVAPHQIQAAQLLDNGPVWLGLLLDSADTVLGLTPDHARLKDLGQDVGVIHMPPTQGDPERAPAPWCAFAAPMGNPEDPVTGSLNASLAQWLIAEGPAPPATWWRKANAWAGLAGVHPPGCPGQVWVGATP